MERGQRSERKSGTNSPLYGPRRRPLLRPRRPTIEILADGTRRWLLDGQLHREEGPALIAADGGRQWYHLGRRHRTDGPAIEWAGGGREWWLEGHRHRPDGPAIEWPDGYGQWYWQGRFWPGRQRQRADSPWAG